MGRNYLQRRLRQMPECFSHLRVRRRKIMNQMKKYRHRWSYDPQAQKKAQLPPLTLAIIMQGAVGAIVVWAIICLAWLAF